ncbi:hypothetical protein BC827DRAFT_874468 [Russula dissimulans]|nr:hypothetical protein BC827DRAFT_874468 [Russula dissimulans]
MPLSGRRGNNNAHALANAPLPQDRPGRRPCLLKMLQHHIGTSMLGDTLDWDALSHFKFDASMLSLDNVYKALNRDMETYYFLWVAVRKVLAAEAPNFMFSGARVSADQKAQFLDGLLDAALQQFLAELGDALMNFVEGPHCTVVDPRVAADPHALRAKARSLIARFEKLGRGRDVLMVAIPATEAGIEAAAKLQREDGINVILTSVSGLVHATACAQAGAVAVTLPITKMRDWRRSLEPDVTDTGENPGTGGDDPEAIFAYFQRYGLSSTGLIASRMDHVDDACSLGAIAALSFDADQARKAEWYTAYPRMPPLALSEDAVRRAEAFPPPRPPPRDGDCYAGLGTGVTKHMGPYTFSAYAEITSGAVGSGRASMSMIADIAKGELDWQLSVMQPSSSVTTTTVHHRAVKRKRSLLREEEADAEAEAPDAYRPHLPPQKRARRGLASSRNNLDDFRAATGTGTACGGGGSLTAKAKTKTEEKQKQKQLRHYDRHYQRAPPPPQLQLRQVTRASTPPCCLLWERLGGRNVSS